MLGMLSRIRWGQGLKNTDFCPKVKAKSAKMKVVCLYRNNFNHLPKISEAEVFAIMESLPLEQIDAIIAGNKNVWCVNRNQEEPLDAYVCGDGMIYGKAPEWWQAKLSRQDGMVQVHWKRIFVID